MSKIKEPKKGIKYQINTFIYFFAMVNRISKSYIPVVILNAVIKAIAPFLAIIIPKFIIDELIGKQRIDILVFWVVILVLGNFFLKLISGRLDKIIQVKSVFLDFQIQKLINEKSATIDYKYLEDPTILDLKERAFFAIFNHNAIGNMIDKSADLVQYIIGIIGVIGLVIMLDYYIILLVVVVAIINGCIYNKIQISNFKGAQEHIPQNRVFGYLATCTHDFTIAKDMRLYNIPKVLTKRIKDFFSKSIEINERVFIYEGKLTGIMRVISHLQMVIVYFYLAIKTLNKIISIGDFTMYAGAIRHFSLCISSLLSIYLDINQSLYFLSLYKEYEALVGITDEGNQPLKVCEEHTIEFRGVYFKYPKSESYVLKNVNVTIQSGEVISVVGLNGAGKTTFIKLLTRLYEPTKGEILLDGVNINDYLFDDYVKIFSVVFQDFKLLAYSLKENIVGVELGKKEQEVINILRDVGFEEDLLKLDNGLDTNLAKIFDKSGVELSGGQQQKIAIARAICKDGPFVVLDEPTAALDPISEHEIYKKFHMLTKNKTAIYISHRLSSCRFSDRILVFDGGTISQNGAHEQLVDTNGLYATMWHEQAKYYE